MRIASFCIKNTELPIMKDSIDVQGDNTVDKGLISAPCTPMLSTEKGGLYMILFLLLFFLLQSFVLFCCLAAGNDPASQAVSDEEQIRYIRQWMELHKR